MIFNKMQRLHPTEAIKKRYFVKLIMFFENAEDVVETDFVRFWFDNSFIRSLI